MKYLNTKLIVSLVATICSVAMIVVASADDHTTTKGGELVIENPTLSQRFHIASLYNNNDKEFISNSINTDFPFNAVAFSWNAPEEVKFQIFTRFQKESWTDWKSVQRDVDVEENDKVIQQTSSIIFTPYTNILQYKIVFENSAQSDQLKNLKINYIDSTKGGKSIYTAATAANDSLHIITRNQWGANESDRFDASGEEKWPREYYTPKRFIIHHTDSSDVSNPMATVRAINYFHTVSHNWGDIGYNYLIDNQGNIYEGRSGGDAVTGAHASMNNRGSIGIAILGCYHPGGNCPAPGQLTESAHQAMERLIAVKSQQFGIDPNGQQKTADGKTLPTIVGHKDVGQSNCPGDNIYTQLGVIKIQSNLQLTSLAPLNKYATSAELISSGKQTVEVAEGSTRQFKIKIKNTGQATWHGYEDDYLFVGTDVKKLGLIDGYKFASVSPDAEMSDPSSTVSISGKLLEGNVKPGEVGTFVISLKPENATKTYALAWKNKGYFSKTDFTITTVKVRGQSAGQPVFVPIYKSTLLTTSLPDLIPAGTSVTGQLTLLNAGNVAWSQNDLVLYIPNEVGVKSDLLSSVDFHPVESDIQPGAVATFNITFTAPTKQSAIWHIVKVNILGNELLNYNKKIVISGPYSAEISSDNLPSSLKKNTKAIVTITVKNTGSKAWSNPTLKSTSDKGTSSALVDPSWNNLKIINSIKKIVNPGEEVTFKFKVWAPTKVSATTQLYKLWDGKQAVVLNGMEVIQKTTSIVK